jgi:hypothetical protein
MRTAITLRCQLEEEVKAGNSMGSCSAREDLPGKTEKASDHRLR